MHYVIILAISTLKSLFLNSIIIEQLIYVLLLPCSSDAFFIQARLFQHLHESFSGGILVNSS